MSAETATPKNSILTEAMLRARAHMTPKETDQDVQTPEEIAVKKRNLKKLGLILAGSAAVVTAAIVVAMKTRETEEDFEESTDSED